ncbi:hypothetical protein MHW47_10790 [Streptomyces sp. OfavH-34-F]|uniref:hypothetical protein n=1 Tax=Streptomyces sp. OfavH-34-F TaxID=2917760 RepID=UPI001EF16A39|nr:hypothetical protein [Streptomyces sp. OfavH-34-F]MCG7524920.1 hypothetical protein [Streptomyces sp. OfavH-34-F]
MTRIPSSVSVASIDTHSLIVAVPKAGAVDIVSSVPREVAATMLRQLADQLTTPAGRCKTARYSGRPCPVHDAKEPASVADAYRAADDQAAAPFTPRTERERWQDIADTLNAAEAAGTPVGIDLDGTLTDHHMWSVIWDRDAGRWEVAGYEDDDQAAADDTSTPAPSAPPQFEGELTGEAVRDALDFNDGDRDQVLATLRDVLLDTSLSRTPDQALAAARILLTAHARQVAALIEAQRTNVRAQWGLTRSTRGLLTGYEQSQKIVTAYADGLAIEQALATTDTETGR